MMGRYLFFFLLLSSTTASIASDLLPGAYDKLIVSKDKSGDIRGYYQESLGKHQDPICSFYFYGHDTNGDNVKVVSWSSEQKKGEISASDTGVVLKISEGTEHDGCINVIGPQINTGVNLKKIYVMNWQSLVTAKNDKVYIYALPVVNSKKKGWIIQQDVAGVVEKQNGFTHIQYIIDNKKVTDGWVLNDAVDEVVPPQR